MEYLCLAIGNSRLHWAYFQDGLLKSRWDTIRECHEENFDDRATAAERDRAFIDVMRNMPLYIASVVPKQTIFWQNYSLAKIITLADLPLQNLYSTLGIDRALAVFGAGIKYDFPCLVIDGGTALTFTGVDRDKKLIGGAILAGFKLQLTSLFKNTAALPKIDLSLKLPERWAINTETAILSGITHTILAGIDSFIADWLLQYPQSKIVITGGDGEIIYNYLAGDKKTILDENIIFWGMQNLIERSNDNC